MRQIKSFFKKSFFKERKNELLCAACYGGTALFVAGVFFLALFLLGVYPFSQTYMSGYDLNAQIAPLLEHFFDVFSGKSSLFYTYSLAGGVDMFGSLVYCCLSPFTFIYFFFGAGRVCYGTSVVLPLKLVCVSLSALYYLRKRFKNVPPFIQCMLAVCYTYCGYLFVGNTYINWVDLLIYLPFLAAGFKKLIDSGKKLAFAVPLALMLYTSFSITAFSLFIIFPIALAYVFFYFGKECEKSVKINKICDICFALVIAVAVSLPLMLPSLVAFASSSRKGGIFENLLNDLSANPLYYKFTYILTDGFTLVLTLYYFAKHGIDSKKAKFFGFTFVLSMLPVLCDECMLLLNFGSYLSYSLRFGFINGFYFFFVAATVLEEEFESLNAKNGAKSNAENIAENNADNAADTRNDNDAIVKSDGKNPQKLSFFKRMAGKKVVYACVISLVTAGVMVGWYFLYRGLDNETYINAFAARFAHSEGGLEATCLIFAGVLCVLAAGVPFLSWGKLSFKPLALACAVLLCGQVCFYDYALVKGNSNSYDKIAEIGEITDSIAADGDGYERIKFNGDYLSADAPLTLHTNSFTVFSSMVDEANFAPTSFFGYTGNGKNLVRSYYGTLLGDCLLGYEYFITTGNASLPCYDGEPAYKSISGTYRAYKNEWVFPHAFKVSNGKLGELDRGDAADYNELLGFLGAQTLVYEYDPSVKESDVKGALCISFKYDKTGTLYVVCDAPEGVELEYCTGKAWDDESAKSINRGQVIKRGHASWYSNSNMLVRAKNGEALDEKELESWFSSFILADDSVQEASEKANLNAVKITLEPNVISAETYADSGEYLFLNYIALKGHTAYVNGKKVELEKNGLNFMILKLEEGRNEVKIVYRSPYIGYALAGAAIGLLLVFAVLLVYKIQKIKAFVFGGIYYAAIGLCLAILAFFFVMPLALMLFKAVKSGVLNLLGLFFK